MIRDNRAVFGLKTLAFTLGLAALSAGCGAPKQAVFTVEGCSEAAFNPTFSDAQLSGPVVRPGDAGAWDGVDVLNPSVVRRGDEYLNLYSGFDGAVWRTGLALSADGVAWRKSPRNPVIAPDPASWEANYIAANGAVLEHVGELLYWYQAGPRGNSSIGLARSSDAETFTKLPDPVLRPGPPGSWDETAVGDPYVLLCGDSFYLFYLGQNRFGVQRLGLARSSDGIVWQKSHVNPLLEPGGTGEFDERGLGEPAVFRGPDGYRMLYTGRDRDEKRALGWAESDDGFAWRKAPELGIVRGSQQWDAAVLCDPTFWFEPAKIMVWFGGGNLPAPDEHLNGRIGFASITSPAADSR